MQRDLDKLSGEVLGNLDAGAIVPRGVGELDSHSRQTPTREALATSHFKRIN